MDQCRNCVVRGQIEVCEKTPCTIHEDWYVELLKTRLAEAEAQRDGLVEFAKEYLDAWKNGMASDSYLLRMAREALAKLEEK